ncbi:DUF58 domain-containing protein [Sphaerobacter thermophilus]|uniref:DUF58 domain-containing protein n=1 Tax=Sphaerobacter thermophilus (strain ATCC 49802 / DSM 20745 / KCCM 41009 / NCIMB 13125 / S 6022) TaxID=479434 RepID=D1C600_SPHTD|nr:DUF58 domain-containing protein [Sphaerobacter thermophilus]ACZ39552.1 protein of unknown function DUF58 [Sphaerobacter thermophilus DSM 20745]
MRSNFFTSIWIYGAGVFLLLGMALRQPALSILALLTLLTAGGSWLWSRRSLDGVVYERTLSATRVFRGESIVLTASVVNRKWLPLPWLEVEDQISDRVKVRERETLPSARPGMTLLRITTSVRWFERVTWTFHLDCPERGAYVIGPPSLRSGDLFGFFSREERRTDQCRFIVYPRVVPLEDLGLPALHPFGERRVPHHLITDPARTIGIRDYRPEDSFRFIHWKATARMQEVQVKVFEPTVSVHLGVFLCLDTFERYWEGVDYQRAESAIVAAASIAAHGLEQRYLVGMYANGVLAGSDQALRIPAGRGPDQLTAILEGLAKLTPLAATNFPRLLRQEARRFPWGSTVVVVAALMTTALANELAALLAAGHRVVLVGIGEVEPPPLPGLVVHTLPENLLGATPGHRYVHTIDLGVSRP